MLEAIMERWLIGDAIDAARAGRTSTAAMISDLISMDLAFDRDAGDDRRLRTLSNAEDFLRQCEPPPHATPPRTGDDA